MNSLRKRALVLVTLSIFLISISLTTVTLASATTYQKEEGHYLNDDYGWGRITVTVTKVGAYYQFQVKFDWHIILNYDYNSPQCRLTDMVIGIIYTDYGQVIYSKLVRSYNWMWNPATNLNEYVGLDGPADKSFSYTYGPTYGGGGNYVAKMIWFYVDGSSHTWEFPVQYFYLPGPF